MLIFECENWRRSVTEITGQAKGESAGFGQRPVFLQFPCPGWSSVLLWDTLFILGGNRNASRAEKFWRGLQRMGACSGEQSPAQPRPSEPAPKGATHRPLLGLPILFTVHTGIRSLRSEHVVVSLGQSWSWIPRTLGSLCICGFGVEPPGVDFS